MKYIIWRLFQAIPILWAIYTIAFLMVVTVPWNPFQQPDRGMPEAIQRALEARYHIDDNWSYYWEYLLGIIRLDFGPSFQYRDWTCTQIIAEALPVSCVLGLLAVLMAVLVGVPVGVVSAVKRNSWFDVSSLALVLIGISLPTFVTGTALLIVFALKLQWFPVAGWGTFAHLPLPAFTLSLPFMAYIARLTRLGMLDVMGSDYIRTAFAKGVARREVIWKHALKNAFLPVLSFLGPALAAAMTGSFVIEKLFNVPGLGQHFVNSVLNLDRGLIMGTVLVYSALLVVMNLVVDVLYSLVDPRVRVEQ
ncbi:MAG: ABC transporter permease [Planctomycetota bacterium]|nr:MAG: ABC transporter permease [Planctomycetota bacterium]